MEQTLIPHSPHVGLCEAGYYPGVLYHLSFWFPADNMPLRIAFFYACGQFSGTISGLLAYALSFMNEVQGLYGWQWVLSASTNYPPTNLSKRWLFIIEGTPPICCGIYSFFFLPNFPDSNAKFLTEEDRRAIVDSLPKTQPRAGAKTWNAEQAKALFKDPTFPTFTLIWMCHAIGGWGVGTVLPTVIYELGLTDTAIAQLMTMVTPPPSLPEKLTLMSTFIQPAYAFGCSCLILWGYLIRKNLLSPWITAIGRK